MSHHSYRLQSLRLFRLSTLALLAAGAGIFATHRFSHNVKAQTALTGELTWSAAGVVESGPKAIKYAADFGWTATPADDLSRPGPKVVHLTRCAAGVTGANPYYWVYISGTGTPEAVHVVRGTCAGDGNPGTLEFPTVYSHPAGYTIASATAGIQEASIAARVDSVGAKNDHSYQGGYVRVGPGQFQLYAPLTILASDQTVDFSGSSVGCNFDADCVNVGDRASYNATLNVTLVNPRGQPTALHGQHSFITVWGQKTRIFNLMTMPGKFIGGTSYGTFGSYVTVASDQAFLLDGLDTTAGFGMGCTATNCNAVIKAPGPFSGTGGFGSGGDNAALGWLKNLNLNLQCTGNGIDWESGNGVRISDSVIQGYSQFGIRGGLTGNGGYNMIELDNVYEEVGNCTNPQGNVGIAGVIINGGRVTIHGGEAPQGTNPLFANTGTTDYYYYVLPHSAAGYGNQIYVGHALTNKSGNITITFYQPGATELRDFSLLRQTWSSVGYAAPSGTGNYAVALNVSAPSACTNGICTVIDTQARLQSISIPSLPPTWFPYVKNGVGGLVLGGGGGGSIYGAAIATVELNNYNAIGLFQNNVLGMAGTAVHSLECLTGYGGPLFEACLGSIGSGPHHAQLLQSAGAQDGGNNRGLKGRTNYLAAGSGPTHIITLVDSYPDRTIAANSYSRPTYDRYDAFIGCDTPYCSSVNTGLSLGAPTSISHYISNVGDGKNWKERLTDRQKTFAVPVAIESGNTLTLGSGTALSQIKMYTTNTVVGSNVHPQSCTDVRGTAPGLTETDQITGIRPPKPFGNLSLNAYAEAANVVILHFCNPTALPVISPAGNYSFLAVH